MPKFVLTGLTHPLTYELEQGLNTVGRNPTNELRIRDSTVSSFHCEMVLDHGEVLVRDLGSSNGTFIDGVSIEVGRVQPGAVVRLGSFELRLEVCAEAEEVRVTVPELPAATEPTCAQMPDGLPACLHHPFAYATFSCTSCHKKFCPDCVRMLQLARGKTRVFCPSCSGLCDALPVPSGVSREPSKKPLSMLGRLSQTIHLRPK